jgi:hypothetical protein
MRKKLAKKSSVLINTVFLKSISYLKVKKYKQTIQKLNKLTPIYAGGLSFVLIAPRIYISPKAKETIAIIINKRVIAIDIVFLKFMFVSILQLIYFLF